jgi:hypothetical protein
MFQKINLLLQKLEIKGISNPKYLFFLAFFNLTLLMDYSEIVWIHPILISVVVFFTILSTLNYKLWWTSILILSINFYFFAFKVPRVPNHTNIEFGISMLILGLCFFKLIGKNLKLSPDFFTQTFRICLITIYFYTGFNKLNTDFFNPCVSCVNDVNVATLENLTGLHYAISDSISVFFQYSTLFIEMISPFGLLFSKTRKWTAISLLFFHFYLAFTVYADFSALASFLILGCIFDFKYEKINQNTIVKFQWYAFFIFLATIVRMIFEVCKTDLRYIYFVHGCFFNIGLLIFYFSYFRKHQTSPTKFERKYFPIYAFCVLIISFWTLKSYIGLGNSANLTMFSNLMTEKSKSNHLLIDTKKTKIFNFEEDNLLILKLHDTLKNNKLEKYKLPMCEFKYMVGQWSKQYPNLTLNAKIVYKNDTIVIADLKKSKFNSRKWWYKYINFRKIQPENPNKCIW